MSGSVFKVPILSRMEIRNFTDTIRKKARISGLYFPVIEILEFVMPKIEEDFILEIGTIFEMKNNHGLTIPSEKKIILREDVYHGALDGIGRDRMTVAHELGHYFLHRDISFARSYDVATLKRYESSEWQANCFGGELLVPASHARQLFEMTIEEIAFECGVSTTAANIQMNEIRKSYHNQKNPSGGYL